MDVNRDRGGFRGGGGVARGREARWRVEEWTKKFNPAVDNPTVAVPKLKPKGNEGVKVERGDENLGRARAGDCRYWARKPRQRTMAFSKASAERKKEPGSRGRSRNKTAQEGKTRR